MFSKRKILTTDVRSTSLGDLSIVSVFRVGSQFRMDMAELGFKLLFSQPFSKGIPFYVYDNGSPEPWSPNLEAYLNRLNADRPVIYHHRSDRSMPELYLTGLKEIKTKYFYMGFEDQPAIGLNDDFIRASCRLLDSFAGLVDIVMIDGIKRFEIDDARREVKISLKDLHSYPEGGRDNAGPIRVVNVDGYEFGIYRRKNYGFFLNALIAPKDDYARRLRWYLEHVSGSSPQKIELSTTGFWKRGPVYKYVAIPRQAFMLDIDFEPTQISTRSAKSRRNKGGLFDALKKGYSLSVLD